MNLKEEVIRIIRAPDIDTACKKVNEFFRKQRMFRVSKATNELVDKFLRDFESLTMYLQYPKGFVPMTVNVSENMNKQLKTRLSPIVVSRKFLQLKAISISGV